MEVTMKGHPTNEQCFLEFKRVVKELVLCIGGVFAVHPVDDVVVWELARGLDSIIVRAGTRLLTSDTNGNHRDRTARLKPHPAIEELLHRVDAMEGQQG